MQDVRFNTNMFKILPYDTQTVLEHQLLEYWVKIMTSMLRIELTSSFEDVATMELSKNIKSNLSIANMLYNVHLITADTGQMTVKFS